MPGNHSSACKLYQYDLIHQEASRLHHLSWSYQNTKLMSLFLCSMHHFPNYFSRVPFPDEFFYSLPTKSSMQSACPSIIPLVHYLLPEHKPRICLTIVLVAWRLFQSLREHFSCLTWVPDAIWEALEYLSHPSELITQNLWETYTVFKWQVERCRTFSSCEAVLPVWVTGLIPNSWS